MRAAFHHSYFLPWLGYFSRATVVDVFIILDDVGFRKDHVSRVRGLNRSGNVVWLGIPVGTNRGVPCNRVIIPDDNNFLPKLIRTISYNYSKHPHFEEFSAFLFPLLERCIRPSRCIVAANLELFSALRAYFGLPEVKIIMSSNFYSGNNRTERLISISKSCDIETIVTGDGNMLLVHDVPELKQSEITLLSYPYFSNHPCYLQPARIKNNQPFVPGLSVIDAIFSVGVKITRELILNPGITLDAVYGEGL
ncbi:WbqC family protein [Rhodoplanes sp. SY1]|uniref:WbqC family protein n=1 Tax=Rhodoplanes sp. SY1 TaxID=3166646 RepID=UPI0038B4E451